MGPNGRMIMRTGNRIRWDSLRILLSGQLGDQENLDDVWLSRRHHWIRTAMVVACSWLFRSFQRRWYCRWLWHLLCLAELLHGDHVALSGEAQLHLSATPLVCPLKCCWSPHVYILGSLRDKEPALWHPRRGSLGHNAVNGCSKPNHLMRILARP